ncbi:hypothetical protein LPB19_12320 [Marinobacter salinisoli]|uniref:Lipopolysaccharide biosynthesis protein n=1 Tax=Marinobacter salinisoli TaxID=2769486 RepID=A0ABX7MNX4_9GAMM|nr:hypothetical protein [Marinobacter salinisoli]QSP93976.1 hypothetical protein LPB19_12320 [Marinobacter salinisoli]
MNAPVQQVESPKKGFLFRVVVYGSHLQPGKRRALYIGILLACLAVIWVPIVLLVTFKPATYVSEWTLILPGTGNGLAVSLESIGQASASVASPFTNSSVDPVASYKGIATSKPVLALAASKLGMSVAKFGAPRIKLVDQTSLMEFQLKAPNPQLAQKKSYALYEALQTQLDQLRDDETRHLTDSGLAMISDFNEKLEQAQQSKLEFQIESDIVSFEQFSGLITRLEDSRYRNQELQSDYEALLFQIATMQQGLNLTDETLRAAIALRSDEAFQQQLQRHAEVHTQMSSIDGIWGDDHPQLKQLHAAHDTVNGELTRRGRQVTKSTAYTTAELIELGNHTAQDKVLLELLSLIAERNGLAKRIQTEAQFIEKLQQRIEESAEDSVALENLSRKQQVATAVFSTALAKQDIGNADRYSSYPLVQMLAPPTLPDQPDRLTHKLALIGGAGATLSLIMGLSLLWIRKPWLQKILKSA